MKTPSKKLREMTTLMDETREEMAVKVFDQLKIFANIKAMAAKGFSCMTVTPEYAIDLSTTDAATAAFDRLTDLGFSATWVKTQYPLEDKDANPTGIALEIQTLTIAWR